MPPIARIIAEGYPHHIIQRVNRRQKVFFQNKDSLNYLKLLNQYSAKNNLSIATYYLMPSYVHVIAIPNNKEGLAEKTKVKEKKDG